MTATQIHLENLGRDNTTRFCDTGKGLLPNATCQFTTLNLEEASPDARWLHYSGLTHPCSAPRVCEMYRRCRLPANLRTIWLDRPGTTNRIHPRTLARQQRALTILYRTERPSGRPNTAQPEEAEATATETVPVSEPTQVDPDLRGSSGGFLAGGKAYFVPSRNGRGGGAKLVRLDARNFSRDSVEVSIAPGRHGIPTSTVLFHFPGAPGGEQSRRRVLFHRRCHSASRV